jgi:hypothetical protein
MLRAMDAALLDRLRSHRAALMLGLAALLFGFGFGIVFGAAEDSLKRGLDESAQAVLASHYGGDAAKAKAAVDKAFTYYKRAHLHAGGLGASALAVITLLALACKPTTVTRLTGVLLGFGSLGYPIYWFAAGRAAPGLGGTAAAKKAYEWLAMPTAGALVVGTVVSTALLAHALFSAPRARASAPQGTDSEST